MLPGEETLIREEITALRSRLDELEHQRRLDKMRSKFRWEILGLGLANLATLFGALTLVYFASH